MTVPRFVTPHTANTLKLRRWFITLSAMFTDLHVYMKVTVNGKDRKYFRSIWEFWDVIWNMWLFLRVWQARAMQQPYRWNASGVASSIVESYSTWVLAFSTNLWSSAGVAQRLHVLRQNPSLHAEGFCWIESCSNLWNFRSSPACMMWNGCAGICRMSCWCRLQWPLGQHVRG